VASLTNLPDSSNSSVRPSSAILPRADSEESLATHPRRRAFPTHALSAPRWRSFSIVPMMVMLRGLSLQGV